MKSVARLQKTSILMFLLLISAVAVMAQQKDGRQIKIKVSYNPTIETYFILERLAVERLGRYGYITKETDNSHQPLVKAAFEKFKQYKDSSIVIKTATLLDTLRKNGMFNGEIIGYLLYAKPFPQKGLLYPPQHPSFLSTEQRQLLSSLMTTYLPDMHRFYIKARVDDFIKAHRFFYEGAVTEVKKDIPKNIGTHLERFYGEKVKEFVLVVNPTMPIAPVVGDFRGIGPTIISPKGKIPYMVLSTSVMLPNQPHISEYSKFGYDNPKHTEMMVVHEFGHSFVNPAILPLISNMQAQATLFTPALASRMQPQDITDWIPCVIEHLVSLGEIRVAEGMKDKERADKLRKLHVDEYKFIFLPAMEEKIKDYESNRAKYKTFSDFIPQLLTVFEKFTPAEVDHLVK